MKLHKLTFAIAAVALLGGCSTFQPGGGATYRAGPNYNATGSVSGVRAYVYGNRTLLQYDSAPLSLWVTDNAGNTVEFEEVGGFYRLARKLDHFTARANLLKATSFDLLPASLKAPANPPEQPPVAAAIEQMSPMVYAAPAAQPPKMLPVALDPRPAVKLASEEDAQLKALLQTSRAQLAIVRAAIERGANDLATIEQMRARLDGAQANLAAASGAVLMVHFKPYQTDFQPSAEVAALLVDAATHAETVKIRGRTDSFSPGSLDGKIAQARANSARLFLLGHGVDPEKIKVSSLAAGDRVAPNSTTEGRDVNRRVEVEIINPRIAVLLRDSGAIADSKQASASQATLAN